ncbi:RNA 2',3'-cyclic phosphodiesterase [Siminovitchia terrae]|uniref:RNA 2',3'-cyclic phosphodiesterase n=1 Tax=Siminovitchia terrae TaxID=1914933 RepID=A0A429X1B9_SIMTE|nr:RNA 2',3'-cyclic phosphodiesterase [Siminovitchia terrae]RST57256.1 RNA 2',3'-cyclic phosphodiesterase [Siminovitchia terrae]GIN93058.1 RNA 2',3'-cyclic phosphodiesterase [Siminovitchia terrae]GIN98792.1 RNA 2',3'-cyclic phosphodiesterase [Siminovitchia terrae]
MHSTHYFFALTLPDEVKVHLSKISEQLKPNFPFKNWVHRADYHITLAFLGNADQRRLAESVLSVKEALKDVHSFQVDLNQAGTFGRPDLPRILWVNTTESSSLAEVRDKVYASCIEAGFELETRPFKPHITLARKWMGQGKFQMTAAEKSLASLLPGPVFTMEEAVLYRTHLDRTPKYEMVESFKLI